ncbi:MAG: MBL fold metallo-hydrolase [Anaerolineales bacterium]|nr:MBL fold metallo-hydrolase [Anaerolineales bacterium]
MQITFHGAARTVTGSQHLLEVNGSRILLDCGMYQGKRKESFEINRNFGFDVSKLDVVLLSHAHIDHSGNLPSLVKAGFDGPIFTQKASAHLAEIMLLDSAHIQEADVKYVNQRRARKNQKLFEPLYTEQNALDVIALFQGVDYDQSVQVAPGVRATFVEAGHILGSAAVVLDITENGKKRRVWFSGDIGRYELPLLRDPVLPDFADYLLMECTYGYTSHHSPLKAYDTLRDTLKESLHEGGKVLIPAFAVGRTQELVYDIHRMMLNGELNKVPVIVDSPLATNATDIFKAHRECFDKEAWEIIEKDRQALGFDGLEYTRSVEDSKAINDRHEPMIIISASGMVEHGRILHHLKNNVNDPRSTVLIVSWQAPYTLGRRLVEGQAEITIFGEVYQRKIKVKKIDGFSAHAGQDMLVKYAMSVNNSVKELFLVHGEKEGAEGLTQALKTAGFSHPIHYPEKGSRHQLD